MPGFGPFGDAIWLNCAHQGPLSRRAVDAVHEAIRWKVLPDHLTSDRFEEVPERLRRALGRLVHAPSEEIVLGNSASYGLHLLANGLPLGRGDEVLLVDGDFPATVLPWLGLERRGVSIRWLTPGAAGLGAEDLRRAVTEKTRVLCTTWVHSFTGRAIDVDAVGSACREAGVTFVLNAAQALGARPLDVGAAPVDAVTSVGFKWLCGPYGTGFCWIHPHLLRSIDLNRAYWLAMQTADDLAQEGGRPTLRRDLGVRAYDVFGTANFFNFVPLAVAVEELLEHGIDRIAAHDDALVERLVRGLVEIGFELQSPRDASGRSTLVLASHPEPARNAPIHRALTAQRIFIAHRRGKLRVSPHLYNGDGDVDRLLESLAELA